MSSLAHLFRALAAVCDDGLEIEIAARRALEKAADKAVFKGTVSVLPATFQAILSDEGAHPVCAEIARTPLPWMIPQTSDDPTYVKDSRKKLIVELLGPDGIVPARGIRVGLYGIAPGAYYGYRTHPAEEVFVMLAGTADWAKGSTGFETLGTGGRAYHPSMTRHATITRDLAFLSLYVWCGDVSYSGYNYQGKDAV